MEIVKCEGVEYCFYRVQKDDNIESIARKFSISQTSIVRNNPSVELYDGEVVKILKKRDIQHIVKPMETLSQIANKYNVSEEALIKLNSLTSKRLFIGQRLIIGVKQ